MSRFNAAPLRLLIIVVLALPVLSTTTTKRRHCFRAFPMFALSLSWQMFVFKASMAPKRRYLTCHRPDAVGA